MCISHVSFKILPGKYTMACSRVTLASLILLLLETTLCLSEKTTARQKPSSPPSQEDDRFLPDRPLQLVRPDPSEHRKLIVVEENLKHLHHLTSAVAVVAVVGKYHSGKSFLLNQLMGKKNGFGVGPTLRPQTMGIWMWGKPLEMKVPNETQPLSVIFLDTEGFAASNISESYDAKIFAVTTLLSSYLLYNSVKIIDQADIDYLELLARRTRLFALRSQISKSQWFDSFNHDLLQFPPLLWVVQDFVQMTDDTDSPRDWLHRMMVSSNRDSDHYISLLGIFESVDCHTLFIPAVKKALLQDLSQVREEDLTSEYIEERDALLEIVRTNLVPKEKNGKPITGAELASLVEVLVYAANEGSLAEVPGRWATFVDQLHTSSVQDCITFYETQINQLLRKHNHGPINPAELELWHNTAWNKSLNLLDKLLFGLHNVTASGKIVLEKAMEENFEKIDDMNQKRIELRCGEVQRQVELKVEESLSDLVNYPMTTKRLRELFSEVQTKHLKLYREALTALSGHASFKRHIDHLEVGIERIFHGAELKNEQAMESVLSAAVQVAVEVFKRESENVNRIPRTTLALDGIIVRATNAAIQVFETESALAHDEKVYRVYTGHCKSTLSEEAHSLEKDNMELVKTSCEAKSVDLQTTFRLNTDPKKLSFPLNESELERQLGKERESAYRAYAESQNNFDDTSAYMDVKRDLVTSLNALCEKRTKENYQAYIREVETPLKTAKKSILLSADMYDTRYSLNQYMEKICLVQLDEGKAKLWQKSLKKSIVVHYISSQPDLQRLLASKTGWWSNIKGFFQWLYSFITEWIS